MCSVYLIPWNFVTKELKPLSWVLGQVVLKYAIDVRLQKHLNVV